MPVSASDDQNAGTDDDTCVKTWYATNTVVGSAGGDSHWIIDTPYRTMTYSDPCGTGSTAVQVGQTDTYYDGHTALDAAPTDANVTKVMAYSAAGSASVTEMSYDGLGRVTSVKAPGEVARGTAGTATRTTYSPSSGYPYDGIEVTDPSGNVSRTVPYFGFGTPRRVIDVSNDDTTLIGVDHLGRTSSVTRPGDPAGMPSATFAYRVEVGLPNMVTTRTLATDSTYLEAFEYIDGLGRSIQTQSRKANDGDSGRRIAMTRYDPLGHVIARTGTFDTDGTAGTDMVDTPLSGIPYETRYGYDSAGRVYVETQYARDVAKITNRTHHYGWSHTVDAPVHSDVDYHTDVFGRTTKVVERPTTGTITTDYAYTPLGQLDTITDTAGNVTNYDYDWLGRRTKSVDPDQGTWDTTYTRDGDVKTVTDANVTDGVRDKVVYAYDASRRKTDVYAGSEAAANLLAHWAYDSGVANSAGRLVSSTSYSSDGTAYTVALTGYDNRSRVTGKQWQVPGFGSDATTDDTYTFTYGYTQSDELETVTVPGVAGPAGLPAETVTTVRNAAGLPVRLTTSLDGTNPYVASTTYREDGRVASRSLVGGVTRNYTYDSVNRLSTTVSTAPVAGATAPVEDVAYAYDADSNVVEVRDALAGGVQRECFQYDPLSRLTRAYTTGTTCSDVPTLTFGVDPYDLAYAYDDLGNITKVTSAGTATVYDYTGTTHAHAPVSIGGKAYTYDNNGATTQRPSGTDVQQLTWNRLHQLSSVEGPGASSYVYDADGNRLLRETGGTTTLYLDGMEVAATTSGGVTTLAATRYYGGFAMRTSAGVHVLLRNRQNSTSIAYDTVADTATNQRYTPYGSRRGTSALSVTERRFLDKTEDETGLIAMGARYYDPGIARFISVDPLSDLARPQTLAVYSYSLGNPATLSDPTGLAADDTSGGGPGCENDCADPEVVHKIRYDYVVDQINAGEAPEDEVFTAGNFSEQERGQLLAAMLASPCSITGDRSACAGNSHYIFICQMGGESRCAAGAADAASAGEFFAGSILGAAGVANNKAANSAGARLGSNGRGGRFGGALGRLRARLQALDWTDDTGAMRLRAGDGSQPKLVYEHNPKHGRVARREGGKIISRAPRGDCQSMLECSTPVKERLRHGVEPDTGRRVIFKRHREFEGTEYWHGYVPE